MATVTGYKLRSVLRGLELKLQAANRVFIDSLVKFASEDKISPQEAMNKVQDLEVRMAKLQAAQSEYNTKVKVNVLGNDMSLSEAVKRQGGASRVVALWKKASGAAEASAHYRYREPSVFENMPVRESDKEYSIKAISNTDATDLAVEADAFASALRGAIAEGNSKSVDVDLDPKLLTE